MFVVYKYKLYTQYYATRSEKKSNFTRLAEFTTLEEANEFMQEKMDQARDSGKEVSYTIIMEN